MGLNNEQCFLLRDILYLIPRQLRNKQMSWLLARQVAWVRYRKSRNWISAREITASVPALDLHRATARR
jgi:hypothetical protein